MTADQIKAMLHRRHKRYDWACSSELELSGEFTVNGVTKGVVSRIDFAACQITLHSEAHSVIGYEIKVSRADFLAEMRDPFKRCNIEAECTETWFVAPMGIIKPEELPQGWGLLEIKGDRFFATLKPEWRENANPRRVLGQILRHLMRHPSKLNGPQVPNLAEVTTLDPIGPEISA
jgi:hypothetical protein